MRNEKKVAYQSQRIAELERQVKCLEAENKSMQKDIDRYKKIISSKDVAIDTLKKETFSANERYEDGMREIFDLRASLLSSIAKANAAREEFTTEMDSLITRIKKYK